MNILERDKAGNYIITEESPLSWMLPNPKSEECPFCAEYIWLRIGVNSKGCTECGAQWKLKLGDLL